MVATMTTIIPKIAMATNNSTVVKPLFFISFYSISHRAISMPTPFIISIQLWEKAWEYDKKKVLKQARKPRPYTRFKEYAYFIVFRSGKAVNENRSY
jgi:hypothetical protein